MTGIEQSVVHIDVEDHSASFYLMAGNRECLVVVLLIDESQELATSCHIASLAYIDESDFGSENQRFETGEAKKSVQSFLSIRKSMINPTILSNQMGDGPNMVGCCPTTASNDVYQTFVDEMADLLEH